MLVEGCGSEEAVDQSCGYPGTGQRKGEDVGSENATAVSMLDLERKRTQGVCVCAVHRVGGVVGRRG